MMLAGQPARMPSRSIVRCPKREPPFQGLTEHRAASFPRIAARLGSTRRDWPFRTQSACGRRRRFGDEEARVITPDRGARPAASLTGLHLPTAIHARARQTSIFSTCDVSRPGARPAEGAWTRGERDTGLPIVRTSPDHGTAFDIAGKGVADPGAMIAALKMAGEMAARRASTQDRSA